VVERFYQILLTPFSCVHFLKESRGGSSPKWLLKPHG